MLLFLPVIKICISLSFESWQYIHPVDPFAFEDASQKELYIQSYAFWFRARIDAAYISREPAFLESENGVRIS